MRREQIKLQVGLMNTLHAKRKVMLRWKPEPLRNVRDSLIENAEALGEPPENPLLFLFGPMELFGLRTSQTFNGDVVRELAQRVANARREARGKRPAHDSASQHRAFPYCIRETLQQCQATF